MKRLEKICILILAVVLTLGLCSCSSDAGKETNDSKEETQTETDAAATVQGELTDSEGEPVTSGSANISFDQKTVTINAAYLIDGRDVTIDYGTYESLSGTDDETVFLVINGGSLTITASENSPVHITKTGSSASSGQVSDEYNFYGINSAIVVSGNGSKAVITGASIDTDANGSNAVVATNGGYVNITNSVITTSGEAGSRGLHATYGGIIDADNVSITTKGRSCAALATDRGGGTVTASNMILSTSGAGSPLIYSTGNISVSSSTGTAHGAQMVVVEGGSSAAVNECDFSCSGTGNRTGTSESNGSEHEIDACGIFIYQSFSGDASEGTDYFTAVNSTFTVETSGIPMFFITNISAEITLEGNTFISANESDLLFMAEETSEWGRQGSNGGNARVTLTAQPLSGALAFVGTSSSSLEISSTDGLSTDLTIEYGTW